MTRPLLPNLQDLPGQQQLQHSHPQQQPVDEPAAAPDSPNSNRGGRGGSGKPQYAKRGKITIVACVPCRKRKTKCDGKRPACGQCLSRNGRCVYDMTDDQRKLTYLRDNVEQLQEKSSIYESLLNTLKSASEEEALEVFRRLRSGADIQMVAEQVQAGRLLSGVGRPVPSDQSLVDNSPSQGGDANGRHRLAQYEQLLDIIENAGQQDSNNLVKRVRLGEDISVIMDAVQSGHISPQRLIRESALGNHMGLENAYSSQDQTFGMVKGAEISKTHAALGNCAEFMETTTTKPWSSVTQDEELIEHILGNYFTWQHSFFQSFPERAFRADMKEGRTKYCSSILVNAICAAGCFLSEDERLTKTCNEGKNLADRFYEEAVSQLDAATPSSITTTAALYLISYVEGTRGRLSTLWMFSGRSVLMAFDLNLHLKRSTKQVNATSPVEMKNERRARCHAFWGAFHVDQITAFTLGRLPNINVHSVTLEAPPIDPEEDQEPWTPSDPKDTSRRPGATSSTFHYCASLSRIVNSALSMFFAPMVPLSGSLLLEEYSKYVEWHHTLPDLIRDTSNAPPHVLCLHMYYHAATLHLFRPFLKATIDGSRVIPRDVCRNAANAISDLITQHRFMYGLQGIYMFQVHCLLTACTIHIINIPTISSTRYFTQACNLFQDLVSRNEWARSSLAILRTLVEKWGLILPLEAEEALCRDQVMESSSAMQHHLQNSTSQHQQATDPSSVYDDELRRNETQSQRDQSNPALLSQKNHEHQQVQASESSLSHAPKRSSSSSASGMQAEKGTDKQKRPRLAAPGGPQQGNPSTSPWEMLSGAQSQVSAVNYLYAPLAGQPAPMLYPVHGTGAPGAGRGNRGRVQNLGGGAGPTSSKNENASNHGHGARLTVGQGASRTMPQTKREGGGVGRLQNGVEGLSFGDDWRDPFMGFLGQEE